MPETPAVTSKREFAARLLATELQRLGRGDLSYALCFSDREWRIFSSVLRSRSEFAASCI